MAVLNGLRGACEANNTLSQINVRVGHELDKKLLSHDREMGQKYLR
jgi:hypothetical protein